MATIIQLRNDTAANFTQYNPTLAEGEIGLELDTKKIKVGDGVKTWNQLDYWVGPLTSEQIIVALGYTPYDSSNPSGYISGITSADVIEALGFTPYSDSNPEGYISGITSSDVTTALGFIPYDSSNPEGYTSNVGTVTSVNNIEPINGNVTIEIPDSATWGNITGNIADQTDLSTALGNKVDKTSTANKVYGTDINGDQTTYDVDSFGQVDDVTVGGTSVVTNKVAVLGSMAGETASNYVLVSNVVNDVVSTDTNKPLSANMGKELQDQIDNLKARGRFLALWDCSTGLAETHPTVSPYEYKAGDYFIIGTVAQAGGTNYKPSGSSYTDNVPSTAVETEDVNVDDVYYYDGNVWHLQINTRKEVAFANIAGDPYDNSNLASALNAKQDELPSQTGQSGKFLTTNGTAISWGDVTFPVTDVQINSTSILSDGVAYIPIGTSSALGVYKVNPNQGISAYSAGDLVIISASEAELIAKTHNYKPIVPSKLDIAVREGLGNNSLTWTDAYKASARNTIGATQAVFVDWEG